MSAGRLGVAFSRGLAPADVVACVRLAETLGYESAWMAEGHAGDQFAILGACAVATERIGLGTSISSVFVRSAPTIAMAAATVDDLSGGRFILGLGTTTGSRSNPSTAWRSAARPIGCGTSSTLSARCCVRARSPMPAAS